MTPLTARLTFVGFVLLALGITVNALLLQPTGAPRLEQPAAASGSTGQTRTIADLAAAALRTPAPSKEDRADGGESEASGATPTANPAPPRVPDAILRELGRKGYSANGIAQQKRLNAMVLAYEFDSGLPLSGEPDAAILKRLLFDLNRAPRGAFADRAEADRNLVLYIQKRLLELGFFSGSLSGRMDAWTQAGIAAFERFRRLPVTERFSEETLLDLIAYTGQPIPRESS